MGTPEKKTTGYKERCAKKRQTYQKQLVQLKAAGKSVVYADESGFADHSYRQYGYAPRGEEVFGLISSQRTRTTTLIAARFEDTFTAARLFKGSCKAKDFNDWLAEELCPRLNAKHIVILDNARLHKTHQTRELIEAAGALLMFLPLIRQITIPSNTILLISNEYENITHKSLLTILFKCISNSIIYHNN